MTDKKEGIKSRVAFSGTGGRIYNQRRSKVTVREFVFVETYKNTKRTNEDNIHTAFMKKLLEQSLSYSDTTQNFRRGKINASTFGNCPKMAYYVLCGAKYPPELQKGLSHLYGFHRWGTAIHEYVERIINAFLRENPDEYPDLTLITERRAQKRLQHTDYILEDESEEDNAARARGSSDIFIKASYANGENVIWDIKTSSVQAAFYPISHHYARQIVMYSYLLDVNVENLYFLYFNRDTRREMWKDPLNAVMEPMLCMRQLNPALAMEIKKEIMEDLELMVVSHQNHVSPEDYPIPNEKKVAKFECGFCPYGTCARNTNMNLINKMVKYYTKEEMKINDDSQKLKPIEANIKKHSSGHGEPAEKSDISPVK